MILAIDPGSEFTAYTFYDPSATLQERIGQYGKVPNQEVIALLENLQPEGLEVA